MDDPALDLIAILRCEGRDARLRDLPALLGRPLEGDQLPLVVGERTGLLFTGVILFRERLALRAIAPRLLDELHHAAGAFADNALIVDVLGLTLYHVQPPHEPDWHLPIAPEVIALLAELGAGLSVVSTRAFTTQWRKRP
jgi:hypothetical protein